MDKETREIIASWFVGSSMAFILAMFAFALSAVLTGCKPAPSDDLPLRPSSYEPIIVDKLDLPVFEPPASHSSEIVGVRNVYENGQFIHGEQFIFLNMVQCQEWLEAEKLILPESSPFTIEAYCG